MVIVAVYRRLLRDGEAFRERVALVPAGPPSVTALQLAEDAGLATEVVRVRRAHLEAVHGRVVPSYVAATRVLHDYAWPACLLVSAPWFLAGAVPTLAAGDVALDPVSGRLSVRVPAAGVGATPGNVRRVVAEHHAPLLAALAPHLRRGDRAAWGTVADDLVSGLWWLGRLVGDEAAGVRAATEILPSPTSPLPGAAAFRRVEALDGVEHVTRTRTACCLHYRLEADACLTCPRTSDAERRARLVGC